MTKVNHKPVHHMLVLASLLVAAVLVLAACAPGTITFEENGTGNTEVLPETGQNAGRSESDMGNPESPLPGTGELSGQPGQEGQSSASEPYGQAAGDDQAGQAGEGNQSGQPGDASQAGGEGQGQATGSVDTSSPTVIGMLNTDYESPTLNIQPGETVTWINTSSVPHTVSADRGAFESGTLNPGESYEYTFTDPGEYVYHCEFHGGPDGRGMSGVIIVGSP